MLDQEQITKLMPALYIGINYLTKENAMNSKMLAVFAMGLAMLTMPSLTASAGTKDLKGHRHYVGGRPLVHTHRHRAISSGTGSEVQHWRPRRAH
jgi:hypothetical protein